MPQFIAMEKPSILQNRYVNDFGNLLSRTSRNVSERISDSLFNYLNLNKMAIYIKERESEIDNEKKYTLLEDKKDRVFKAKASF